MGFLVRDSVARVIPPSPEACFRLLTQSSDVNVWWRGVKSSLEGQSPWVQGTRLTFQSIVGRPRWIAEVKEVLPQQLVEMYYTEGDLTGAASWEFEPVGAGTRVVHRWLGVEAATPTGRALLFT